LLDLALGVWVDVAAVKYTTCHSTEWWNYG